jgi:hypothetical protein
VAHVVVAEPVLFLSGPDYCTMFKIKQTDGQCEIEWTTVDSHLKLSLPVSDQPLLRSFEDSIGEADCIGGFTTGGTCPIKSAAFTRWVKENPAGLVAVTTTGGRVTRLAEMYTP